MNWPLVLIAAVTNTAFFAAGWHTHRLHTRQPYRWHCPEPGCEAEAGANDPAVLIHVVEAHAQAAHR